MRTESVRAGCLAGFLSLMAVPSVGAQEAPVPPRPEARPVTHAEHGVPRVDEYYWLRDRDDPAVVSHLEAENAYVDAVLADTEAAREALFDEIVGRIRQDDSTVPVRRGDWWYRTRFEEGKEYPIHVRMRGGPDGPEEVVLDANRRAEGHDYYAAAAGPLAVSPDGRILAVAEDTIGRRVYTIRFRDLASGDWLPGEIPAVTPSLAWANDSRTLFYVRQDPQTLRPFQVLRHRLGTDPADDPVVFEETDETFSIGVGRTKSGRFVLISSHQTLSTEVRALAADDPRGAFRVLLPRERNHEYSVDHLGEHWLIRTNRNAPNFRLVRAPLADPAPERWTEIL
ncbi:MAG: oligopeptidase B, partial [Gemmatimonadota bacterium]|nr:oligopeptidase B [Gemmatimonadota bacterium]